MRIGDIDECLDRPISSKLVWHLSRAQAYLQLNTLETIAGEKWCDIATSLNTLLN